MGLLGRKKTAEELDEDLDRLKVEGEIVSRESEIAERKQIIRGLRQRFGPDWRSILGLVRGALRRGSNEELWAIYGSSGKGGSRGAGGPPGSPGQTGR